MKRSCTWCGRIHSYEYNCPEKPVPKIRRDDDITHFRNSSLWQKKRHEILERDIGLCVVCRLGIMGESDLVPADSVHHITPLSDNFEARLDNDNLISLCAYHHELAERSGIPAEVLRKALKYPPRGSG